MSRHLMARFRRRQVAAASWPQVDWRHGWVLPSRAAELKHFNTKHTPNDPIDVNDFSTGIVHHGEQRYALEIEPSSDRDVWSWGIYKQVGPDENNPDHWEDLGKRPPGCFCGWGTKNGEFGASEPMDDRFHGDMDSVWDDDAEDFDDVASRADAMATAEEAFNTHIAGQGMPNYDLDQLAREHNTKPAKHHFDEDYGDIFGDGS